MPESKALQVALVGLEGISEAFTDPDDDFAAIVIVESKQGELAVIPAYEYLANDEMKYLFFDRIMPDLIRKTEIHRVVMVLSAWALEAGRDYFENDEPPPRDHPDRFEIVSVIEMTGAGIESDRYAYINRDPLGREVPTLGEFHFYPKDATRSGAAITPILEALKEVTES